MASGLYIDALVLKHQVTGDPQCLSRAERTWRVVKNVYACSQVHGIGCFLRPYGGYQVMTKFMEPLGTDQASPLFSGLYRYLRHADRRTGADIERIMLQTLQWYAAQNFEYLYYKTFIHSWNPDDELSQHANSYYLPAIACAARVTGERRWQKILDERLPLFANGHYNVCAAFCWGTDLVVLADLLGERFDRCFARPVLDAGYDYCRQMLAEYTEPGGLKRVCPESAEPGFRPHVDPKFDPESWEGNAMGFAYFATRHAGRAWPRHEADFLIALAALGYERDKVLAEAADVLLRRRRVPEDFSAFLAEDYAAMPETIHLYARSVGVGMVQWWRNAWALLSAARGD